MDKVSSESYVERGAREQAEKKAAKAEKEQKDDRKTVRRKRQNTQKG